MTERANEKIVRTLLSSNDAGRFDYVADDAIYVGPSGNRHEKAWLVPHITDVHRVFPGTTRIDRMLSQGNTVVAETTWIATHEDEYAGIPATHNRFEIQGVHIIEFDDGKITLWKYYLNVRRLEQALGA